MDNQIYNTCADDPVLFFESFCDFPLNSEFTGLLNSIESKRFNIVSQERAVGMSTFLRAYIVWRLIFGMDESILVLLPSTAEIRDFQKSLISTIDMVIDKGLIPRSNVRTHYNRIEFDYNKVIFGVGSKHSGRGFTPTLLVFEGFERMEYAESIWTTILPTLSINESDCIISSNETKNNSFFKTLLRNSIKGESPLFPHRIG